MSRKFREVVSRATITLPVLSTEVGERPYAFLSFLMEWVVGASGMRKDENLAYLFEWEEAIDVFTKKMEKKSGSVAPAMPEGIKQPELTGSADQNKVLLADFKVAVQEAQKQYNDAYETHVKAVGVAATGESFYVTDEAFKAGKAAAKDALEASFPPGSATKAYETKILRFYWALTQSKCIDESDVPTKPDQQPAAAN